VEMDKRHIMVLYKVRKSRDYVRRL
jgi:hypothetical protein